MRLYLHELKTSRTSFIIWTVSIALIMLLCMLMYPSMENEMSGVENMFADMGKFTQAFGLDQLSMATPIGFYAIECGNMMTIGGAMFAALLGITVLAKEEKDNTAEWLLTHPITRVQVLVSKLVSVISQIILFNIIIAFVGVLSFICIGESVAVKEFTMLHIAYTLLMISIGILCFGISAYIKGNGMGIGIGLSLGLYFFNLIANLSDNAEFFKYITPFGYAEASDVVKNCSLDMKMFAISSIISIIMMIFGFCKYLKKDIS